MKVLVTGGAGFIGRWVVKDLLDDGHDVWVLDNLSNSSEANISELVARPGFRGLIPGDVQDEDLLLETFRIGFDLCFHLAARINVQDSIDKPAATFENDTVGTFRLLEACRSNQVKMIFVSTCMVYHAASRLEGIRETDFVKPASPYAGAKLAAEHMVLSYYYAYGLPVVVLRPFNAYGPYQRTDGEGGVVSIFIKNKISGQTLKIYGDGTQTRDLLYVEDCARFIVLAGYTEKANGEIIHAGSGEDITINDLAHRIAGGQGRIEHVPHIHPQSEIPKLLCNYDKAKALLGWKPIVNLEEGMRRTEEWIRRSEMIGKEGESGEG